ncbi:hypothetical protein GGS20DRAFT_593876 [Poronia punctata]|nr:hypothetical protein GGS20DRAFT_593876 [Poronia punctata]
MPVAIYRLNCFPWTEIQRVKAVCGTDNLEPTKSQLSTEVDALAAPFRPVAIVQVAPRSRVIITRLCIALLLHMELRAKRTFDPTYFIVAAEREWETTGVILVAVVVEDDWCSVDSFRIRASDVEEKRIHTGIVEDAGGWRYDAGNTNPSYQIPVYIPEGLPVATVIEHLDPGFKIKGGERLYCCIPSILKPRYITCNKPGGKPPFPNFPSLVYQAAQLHPSCCLKNRYLHKTHLIIIDSLDPEENGMIMARVSEVYDFSISEISGGVSYLRIPYQRDDGIGTRYLTLANCTPPVWPPLDIVRQPVFAVFLRSLDFGCLSIDPLALSRMPGEERVIVMDKEYQLFSAAQLFPFICRRYRFVDGFDKKFFIYVDHWRTDTNAVELVRRDWNGVVRRRAEAVSANIPISTLRSVTVVASEALMILEKGIRREFEGMDNALVNFFF